MKKVKYVYSKVPDNAVRLIIGSAQGQTAYQTTTKREAELYADLAAVQYVRSGHRPSAVST